MVSQTILRVQQRGNPSIHRITFGTYFHNILIFTVFILISEIAYYEYGFILCKGKCFFREQQKLLITNDIYLTNNPTFRVKQKRSTTQSTTLSYFHYTIIHRKGIICRRVNIRKVLLTRVFGTLLFSATPLSRAFLRKPEPRKYKASSTDKYRGTYEYLS